MGLQLRGCTAILTATKPCTIKLVIPRGKKTTVSAPESVSITDRKGRPFSQRRKRKSA